MSLSPQQIDQFKTEGYLLVEDFFDPEEVRAMRREIERFKQVGLLNNVATDDDGVTPTDKQVNLQLCPMYKHSELFRALPFKPKVVRTISQLIGDPFMLHLDQVFLKPGQKGMGTSWHQDNAYFKIRDPLKGTAMWIAVHDANQANGTMRLIPGMFNQQLEHTRDPKSNHHIRCYPDETDAKLCDLKAGGVAFFCYGTPHCTGANTTDHERAGVAYHFLHADYAHDDLIEEGRDYRPYITGPKATGGEKEYGTKVAGQWEPLVRQAAATA